MCKQKALIHTLAVPLEQVKAKHLAEHWLKRRTSKTFGDSLSDVEAHALFDTMADLLPEAKA